jgi:hypothetical protein
MVAPKRKGRYQWKYNLIVPKKKTFMVPFDLLKQIGGNKKKKSNYINNCYIFDIYKKKYKFKNKWIL